VVMCLVHHYGMAGVEWGIVSYVFCFPLFSMTVMTMTYAAMRALDGGQGQEWLVFIQEEIFLASRLCSCIRYPR
jgi:hypothetical protein